MKRLLEQYLTSLSDTSKHGDAREESYYPDLEDLIKRYANLQKVKNIDVTILPKKTEAGNPDFRIGGGNNHEKTPIIHASAEETSPREGSKRETTVNPRTPRRRSNTGDKYDDDDPSGNHGGGEGFGGMDGGYSEPNEGNNGGKL